MTASPRSAPHPTAPIPTAPHPAAAPIGAALGPGLLVVLGLLAAVAPFGIDLYLPAFPAIARELDTSATGVQLTLTGFLVGIMLGQLVFGPLSDRIGRRLPLLIGSVVLILASAAAVLAPNLGVLVAARVLQGLAGAAGMVLGRAIISDLATGAVAARAMSLMMIVSGVAPVVAPLIGGALAAPLGWRGVLAVLFAIALVMLGAVVWGVRETLPADRRAQLSASRRAQGSPMRRLASRQYLGHTIAFAAAFTVMMAYISASPFLYQSMLGANELQYGLLFGANALALVATSAVSARLVTRFGPRTLARIGLGGVAAGSLVMLGAALLAASPWVLAAAVFVVVASLGFVMGNVTALALSAVPGAAGTASALLGALQFGCAAVASPFVSIGGERTALPLAIIMVAASAIALVAFACGRVRPAAAASTNA
ncbi:multidrug effflux MFS transporter [Leucobacter chromiiresistens]|uniref:multidrug effflux MFS transporter n=1 Tax=Leucobacter chromiiresistens TaxID=1079994 RepID=UPI0009E9E2D8|nr:multidrug effflux MFS transporter [Leucobacter chromiiresistens]